MRYDALAVLPISHTADSSSWVQSHHGNHKVVWRWWPGGPGWLVLAAKSHTGFGVPTRSGLTIPRRQRCVG